MYAGVPLTAEAYARAEDAYVATILSFVKEAGGQLLRVVGLESRDTAEALDAMVGFGLPIECVPLREGQTISLSELGVVARMLLRELAWCCLESETTRAHFGYDFYLYLAADRPCPASAALAARSGLFVEPCDSPYAEESS
ncbi:MAG: hypothetical protein JKY65_03965 [Planctomycetes bacterium]|nr:hypothetical protein [Planctomycetota bacterium]